MHIPRVQINIYFSPLFERLEVVFQNKEIYFRFSFVLKRTRDSLLMDGIIFPRIFARANLESKPLKEIKSHFQIDTCLQLQPSLGLEQDHFIIIIVILTLWVHVQLIKTKPTP